MTEYKETVEQDAVIRLADHATVPFDPLNADYQVYLAWLAAGGVPDPAETVDDKRVRCLAELQADYDKQVAAGVLWGGRVWPLVYRDQHNVTGLNTRLAAGHGLPMGGATYPRRDLAGTSHALDAAEVAALGVAMSDRLAALVHDPVAGLEAHRAAIAASDDPDSLKPWAWPDDPG